MSVLLVHEEGQVAWLTMNRPERLNAMDETLVTALREYMQALYHRPEIRVVVLQGAGRVFCAGLDLKERAPAGRRAAADVLKHQRSIRDIMLAMRRCPQPIISVVQGSASGGGFGLALASDIRLATPEARFNAAFIRIGLTACDMGVSYFLPRMVGSSVASELMLTGRFLGAQRALALGLVSHVAEMPELLTEAKSLVADMLRTTPMGLSLTKDCLNFTIDAPSFDAAIAMEDRNQVLSSQSEDFQEGIRAFLDKREPSYQGR
ncbi:enoyl-CoA hydratase/isomerase family protein [Ideonella sp. DXS22W]|uniref:Enoyl-CoA hydratase/isomerase family protein n=1 Tax=Pseudaquabacterium inlustre TaxID=2984192 RepID=A0ABU9CC22_9BURK